MATEIRYRYVTGKNLYALVFNAAGQVRDVVAGAWDTILDADWGDYDIAMTEQGTASGIYYANEPSGLVAETAYDYLLFLRAGGAPAVTDLAIAAGTIHPTETALALAGGGKVTPIDIDTLTFASAMEAILAVSANKAAPSGSDVAFKKRDGATTKVTITYGGSAGERTGSVIS